MKIRVTAILKSKTFSENCCKDPPENFSEQSKIFVSLMPSFPTDIHKHRDEFDTTDSESLSHAFY